LGLPNRISAYCGETEDEEGNEEKKKKGLRRLIRPSPERKVKTAKRRAVYKKNGPAARISESSPKGEGAWGATDNQ